MAKDIYHECVKTALEKDGWTITHDPFVITKQKVGVKLEIDLGLERVIAAEKETEKIVVEVKSFVKQSMTHEFHGVVGQYLNYLVGLEKIASDRTLYLAMPILRYIELSNISLFQEVIARFDIKIITFEPNKKSIISWIK